MTRALETGVRVARNFDVRLECRKDFHETGGIFLDDEKTGTRIGGCGKTGRELSDRFPDVSFDELHKDTGWWNRPFEEQRDYPLRAKRILDNLFLRHEKSDDRVAVITHGDIYRYIIASVLKISFRLDTWMMMFNCGITRVESVDDRLMIGYCNDTSFLPSHLRT